MEALRTISDASRRLTDPLGDEDATTSLHVSDAAVPASIIAFATQGVGHGDENRLRDLLERCNARFYPFDRCSKFANVIRLLQRIRRVRAKLVVMEGTGIAGGVAVLAGRIFLGVPYVVSSGDAVGPFLSARYPLLAPIFATYERILCRFCAGFIGWTPYLAGRALTFGAPRAMTAAGWDDTTSDVAERVAARRRVRERLGIAADDIVFGIAGSLDWNPRLNYCYGSELVRAVAQTTRKEVKVLVVGDGSGREHLERIAATTGKARVVFTGRVPRANVADYLAAMDVGSLPQSVDGVGSFRYTIKLSEYLSASLPIVTGQIPLAYDLDDGWLWRLPGSAPWDERYIAELARLMNGLTVDEIRTKGAAVPYGTPLFDREAQVRRVTMFIQDVLECAASRE